MSRRRKPKPNHFFNLLVLVATMSTVHFLGLTDWVENKTIKAFYGPPTEKIRPVQRWAGSKHQKNDQ